MIPKANTEALLKAPPENKFNNPNKPPSPTAVNLVASTPGRAMYDPRRKKAMNNRVLKILDFNSSIAKICLKVVINLFIVWV